MRNTVCRSREIWFAEAEKYILQNQRNTSYDVGWVDCCVPAAGRWCHTGLCSQHIHLPPVHISSGSFLWNMLPKYIESTKKFQCFVLPFSLKQAALYIVFFCTLTNFWSPLWFLVICVRGNLYNNQIIFCHQKVAFVDILHYPIISKQDVHFEIVQDTQRNVYILPKDFSISKHICNKIWLGFPYLSIWLCMRAHPSLYPATFRQTTLPGRWPSSRLTTLGHEHTAPLLSLSIIIFWQIGYHLFHHRPIC